jgi:hypothetical protein
MGESRFPSEGADHYLGDTFLFPEKNPFLPARKEVPLALEGRKKFSKVIDSCFAQGKKDK